MSQQDALFEIGEDVVCITDSWPRRLGPINNDSQPPQKGRLYRVTGMIMSSQLPIALRNKTEDRLLLRLAEMPDSWNSAIGFRPVRKTDISQFSALLNPGVRGVISIDEKKIGDVKGIHK